MKVKKTLNQRIAIIDVINSITSVKCLCQTLIPDYFQHINTCLFSKLVLHSIKVRSHCNFLKPFLVYVLKIETAISKRFLSNCRSAVWVSYVAVSSYGLL